MVPFQGDSSEYSFQRTRLVNAEIISVTLAMRKNSRWSGSPSFVSSRSYPLASSIGLRRGHDSSDGKPIPQQREADLIGGFQILKHEVKQISNIGELSITTLLAPFIALLISPLSTGPITSTVLASIHAFFAHGLIVPDAPGVQTALTSLSNALSRLKFEGSDPSGDEIVLLRMLNVIDVCMSGPVGALLGDVEVCEMLEAVLTICCQMRRSEVLRRSAETTMHSLVTIVFSVLNGIDPEESEKKLLEDEETEKAQFEEKTSNTTATDGPVEGVGASTFAKRHSLDEANLAVSLVPNPGPLFGLLSIRELLRVVVNLLDPTDPLHTDSIRLTALGILNAALEAGGPALALFSSLSSIMLDRGCKFLFQLARSDNLSILHLSLRVISLVFDSMRQHLKLQHELFLSFTIDRLGLSVLPPGATVQLSVGKFRHGESGSSISSRRSLASPEPALSLEGQQTGPEHEVDEVPLQAPRLGIIPAHGETRELLLETLGHMARQPNFFGDLLLNYDCDLNCEDLFERLIRFLTRAVYPASDSGGLELSQYPSQLLCLDILLIFIANMTVRSESPSKPWPQDLPPPERFQQLKEQKKLLLAGTAKFNIRPKAGLDFLEEKGLLYADGTDVSRSRSLAKFLKGAPRLNKKILGEYISKSENAGVLKEFIDLMDFKGKSVAEALRELLESFRLPGESQQIERITSTFAEVFFASEPAEIKSRDAVFILSFAVIMLNTDLHSPNVRKRMTFEDFQRNLRGVNSGTDFDPEYLSAIYDNIKKREIIMPEEHTGQAGFDYAWKELLFRAKNSGPLIMSGTDFFDEFMFKLSWKSIVSSFASAFNTFDDEAVVQSIISGFRQCAILAGKFQLPEVFDFVVMSLSHATGLLNESHPANIVNFPTVNVDGQSVTVSPLSIRLGTSFRGQLAAVVLFTIANGNGNAIREGWVQIFEMFQTLFLHSLLPTRMLQTEDFLGGISMIPMQGNASTPVQSQARSDGGLLSALSSYLLTPYGNPAEVVVPEIKDSDVENTMSAIDCIAACRLHELYSQIPNLELESLIAATRALASLADRRTLNLLDEDSTVEPNGHSRHLGTALQLPYDPASVFLLETMVSVTVQAPDKVEELWPVVFDHISKLLFSSGRFSVLLIERAVVGLLRIALILAAKAHLRDQLYIALDALGSLPSTVRGAVSEQLTAGLALIIKEHRDAISSTTEWALIFALVRGNALHHGAGKPCLDIVSDLVKSAEQHRIEPLGGLVAILEEFADAPGQALEAKGYRAPAQGNASSPASNPVIERGLRAVELLYSLKSVVPAWIEQSSLPVDQAWKAGWTPLLVALARQSAGLSPEIRGPALNNVQRLLLGPQLVAQGSAIVDTVHLFDRVIFPAVDDLLRPELNNAPYNRGLSEIRLKASTLLCKCFLHFELGPSAVANPDLREIWIITLDFLERLMLSGGRQDQLYEAVPESLKNLILVMNASDILLPPPASQSEPDPRNEQLRLMWDETTERMAPFLPGFLQELLPSPIPVSTTSEPASSITPADTTADINHSPSKNAHSSPSDTPIPQQPSS